MAYTTKEYLIGGLAVAGTIGALTLGYLGYRELHETRVVDSGVERIMGEDVKYVVDESGVLGRKWVRWCIDDKANCVQDDLFIERKVERQILKAESKILK